MMFVNSKKSRLSAFLIVALCLSTMQLYASSATHMGELKKWHKVTVQYTSDANYSETGSTNPFTDRRLIVTFTNGGTTYVVEGYFAADGDAADTNASSGNKWFAHFAPDKTGTWNYTARFYQGTNVSVAGNPGTATDTKSGSFSISATDKSGVDLRGKGMARYVGKHYVQFAETGEYWVKGGMDSPENFMGYYEFDDQVDVGGGADDDSLGADGLHNYAAHSGHYSSSDASGYTWDGGKGQNILGAIKYLSDKGINSIYFLTYNIDGGDGRETYPWIGNGSDKYRYDVSRLEQWEQVFSYMDKKGIHMHVQIQETENDQFLGSGSDIRRKLYHRELVARFAHHLNVTWNLGEENSNTDAEIEDFAQQFRDWDPYGHPIALHIYDNKLSRYENFYNKPYMEAASLQSEPETTNHAHAVEIWTETHNTSRPWIAYEDEQNRIGLKPDLSNLDSLRKETLWGNLCGGGAGVEWYLYYYDAQNWGDIELEDFTAVGAGLDQLRYAVQFFENYVQLENMAPSDSLISSSSAFCLADEGSSYVIYLKNGGTSDLNLSGIAGTFDVKWYDPRNGGGLQTGTVASINGGDSRSLGNAPNSTSSDWAVLVTSAGSVSQEPYGGVAHSLPGTIETEDYDTGGEGVAYHDTTAGNSGGDYRSDDVDVQATGDVDGNYNLGWTTNGEWLEYTVDIPNGTYDINLRLASPNTGTMSVAVKLGDGSSFTTLGTANVPETGNWQNWQTVSLSGVSVSNGGDDKILRLELVGGGFNFNWISFADSGSTPIYTLSVTNGSGDGDYTEGTVVDITADAPVTGDEFDQWTGDTTYVNDPYSSSTTITMPAQSVSLTATYIESPGSSETFQAEDALLQDGTVVETNHSGFNGTGFINFQAASTAEWSNIDGGNGGTATLTFRYALDKLDDRTGEVIVNGVVHSLTMAGTGAWNSWGTVSIDVTLNAGTDNTIVLASTGSDFGNTDEMTVEIHDSGTNILLEAEDTIFSNGTIKNDSNASNGQYVDGEEGFNLTWTLNAASAGVQAVDFRIKVPSESRSMGVYVNNTKQAVLTCSSTSWETQIFDLDLNSGNNTIELRDSEGSKELDVDYLFFTGGGSATTAIKLNSGGSGVAGWQDDTGGSTYSTSATINTSAANTAPEAVYQSERYGDFGYTFSDLSPDASYTVRIHLSENYFNTSGERIMDVLINGSYVLDYYDIYAWAGSSFKAIVEEIPATSDSNGQITVDFISIVNNAKCSGIEILP